MSLFRSTVSTLFRRPSAWMVGVSLLGIGAGAATPAHAELVSLRSGRVLSVKSVYIDASGHATLVLRAGGDVRCPADLIALVSPDEVEYPEPAPPMPTPPAVDAGDVEAALRLLTSRPFDALIKSVATRNQVDPELIHAVIVAESGYAPRARSSKGAMGLMQLMPGTAREYALRNPYDPAANIEVGARHLKKLLDRFTLPLALAAYNAGEGAVVKFGGIPPFRETRQYVDRVVRTFEAFRDATLRAFARGGTRPPSGQR
ncbi:MAG: lytic transglycosylase domain-containing protein [Vicinamibacterales bacterium]